MEQEKLIYERNGEELFLSHATMDLKRGRTAYVYKKHILDKLKEIFKDLDISRNEFYWTVRSKEVSK